MDNGILVDSLGGIITNYPGYGDAELLIGEPWVQSPKAAFRTSQIAR